MKIIGHRGAAGLAPENTLESLRVAKKVGVDALEFDVWITNDGHLVLSHDKHTGRLGSADVSIPDSNLNDIRAITFHNGEHPPTFHEAMKIADKTPVIIDAKGQNWAQPLAKALERYKSAEVTVIALNHKELSVFSQLRPNLPVYALDFLSPFRAIRAARRWKFTGIDVGYWYLNPLTYWLARRNGRKIIIYTINSLWFAQLLRFFYPRISITTNRPDKVQAIRSK
jgi:glycerophosphoryl diester phosphodiesterase